MGEQPAADSGGLKKRRGKKARGDRNDNPQPSPSSPEQDDDDRFEGSRAEVGADTPPAAQNDDSEAGLVPGRVKPELWRRITLTLDLSSSSDHQTWTTTMTMIGMK